MINIDKPGFSLISPRCNCCSEQGALCFSSCTGCGQIVLVCDEVGTVFVDRHNLEQGVYGGLEDDSCVCPKCQRVHVSDFRNSTGDEIQALGYSATQYR